MMQYIKSVSFLALVTSQCFAFTPSSIAGGRQEGQSLPRAQHNEVACAMYTPSNRIATSTMRMVSSSLSPDHPQVDIKEEPNEDIPLSRGKGHTTQLDHDRVIAASPARSTKVENKKKVPNKPAKHGKTGMLSPVVLLVKNAMGDDAKFNKLRAKAISIHSDMISSFVDTSGNPVGQTVLKTLFILADRNDNGTIEEAELAKALSLLGFDWLKEEQVRGIFTRADKDQNGAMDIDEWMSEAPKTLRTNLIKLAKKNGGELGFLL